MHSELIIESLLNEDIVADGYALDFIEDEVGRFSPAANWERYKAKNDLIPAVTAWLGYYAIKDVTPDRLVQAIDRNVAKSGSWI